MPAISIGMICLLVFWAPLHAADFLLFNLDKNCFEHSFKQRKAAMAALKQRHYLQAMQGFKLSYEATFNQKAALYYNRACAMLSGCSPIIGSARDDTVSTRPAISFYTLEPNPNHNDNKLANDLYQQISQKLKTLAKLHWTKDQHVVVKNEILKLSGQFNDKDESLTSVDERADMLMQGQQFFLIAHSAQAIRNKGFIEAEVFIAMIDLFETRQIAAKAFYQRRGSVTELTQVLAEDIANYALFLTQKAK